MILYAGIVAYMFSGGSLEGDKGGQHVAVIRVNGIVMEDKDASASNFITSLREAEANKNAKGILISINSPGGSPIQAERIYDEINRQVKDHPEKKVVAVINELGASAAYYIASAAPTIYASKASLVGSIGVTGSGFGFDQLMSRFGVERRVYASGAHKLFLDPYSPANPEEAAFFKGVLGQVHEEFIERVKAGRGDRLKWTDNPQVFTGLIWAGAEAQKIGLIDKIGTIDTVLENEFSTNKVAIYEVQKPLVAKLADMVGATFFREIQESVGFSGLKM
jgi:protease-4